MYVYIYTYIIIYNYILIHIYIYLRYTHIYIYICTYIELHFPRIPIKWLVQSIKFPKFDAPPNAEPEPQVAAPAMCRWLCRHGILRLDISGFQDHRPTRPKKVLQSPEDEGKLWSYEVTLTLVFWDLGFWF